MKIVLVTGGFDPLHAGHIEYFNEAKRLGDKLFVGVNSDAWLTRKKGKNFLPIVDRVRIIENLKMVDGVILFNDDDDTAIEAVKNVKLLYPNDNIIFANGGDRSAKNVPEIVVPNILLKFGIGGNSKINSSSDLLEQWVNFKNNN
jgi:D-beta-D-heptose 7-phosphate kinase/D-beta-D-heptose 1-phosphate adenosyltransferase